MTENDFINLRDVLDNLLKRLQSKDDVLVLQALDEMKNFKFSSEAVRLQLEQLALHSENADIRAGSLEALNSNVHRTVQGQVSSKLDRPLRRILLGQINEWEEDDLLDMQTAEVLRRRYDYDFAPQSAPVAVPDHQADLTPAATPALQPAQPEAPRPSLLQTLTSEASIKIYLYLGAFFVIAAAAILGAVVPELRLPILILGTFIFGGLAVVIRKRLPQPSFALFIVFSFLLPITANSLEQSLQATFNTSTTITAGYWIVIYLLMAVIWSGGTWLYESRLFSVTALGALGLALFHVGNLFDARPEFHALMLGLTALAGLAGVWRIKTWRDAKFSLPLFLSSQGVMLLALAGSFSILLMNTFGGNSQPLWSLASVLLWGLACVFFIFSDGLYPFFLFPWLAAGSLIPQPWFINTAFQVNAPASAIIQVTWGLLPAIVSEVLHRRESFRKYSLPALLASIPILAWGLGIGFDYELWLGMLTALVITMLYTALHALRSRWWLWTMALLNFVIAYFAFFSLDIMVNLHLFSGYPVLLLTLLFLAPDLFMAKDWKSDPAWRLPLRWYGVLFLAITSILFLSQPASGHIAISYAILAAFTATYALIYQKPLLGYLPAIYLPLAVIYGLEAFHLDAWLPALTALSLLYFIAGVSLRTKEKTSEVFRYSGLALGSITVFTAAILVRQNVGWYSLAIGLLFIAEMYLQKNGWFEIGAPLFFTLGASFILNDFHIDHIPYHLLAYSFICVLADLLAHLTFPHSRPLSFVVRFIAGLLTLANYGFLFTENSNAIAVTGFGLYALLFLIVSLLYRQPNLLYAFTASLPLFVTFLFREFDVTKWIHPVIGVAVLYYATGYVLRLRGRATGWDQSLLYSGLGLGTLVSGAAPILGGLDASLPVAVAATLWAAEAFSKKNAWLAFPANGLYLMAYFIILAELHVDEPQFYSVGAALLGLVQHYLLTRAESRSGAFAMGMASQFVLLGTTYFEMLERNSLAYFFILFLQALIVLVYGIVIRSRSLTFFPIGFAILGVVTVVYSALKDIGSIFLIGCTGILLLMFGVLAVLLRERISKLSERISDWQA